MTDLASAPPPTQTDEALLARFQNSTKQPPSSKTLGFRMKRVDQAAKTIEVAFDVRPDLICNQVGQIQGGYMCAMLDECMSVACMVASGMTVFAPTLEMKTSFFRPGLPGELKGIGRVIKYGRTIAFMEGELYDAEGRLLAKASGTTAPVPFANYKK